MRRTLAVLVAFALGVSACGSDPVGPEPVPAAEASDIDAPASEASEKAEPEPPEAGPEPAAADAPTCGFGEDRAPVPIEIEQIPGDERAPTPSALAGSHPDFPEPLVDVSLIVSGGPPPDGIPPIDAPRFQTAGSVDWLRCTEPVLSLVVGGEARAYPVQIMTWHEIVNDTFGDRPVTVSFCPLCNSALVYDRDIGDRVLDFGTSGRLFNSSLVMYDRTTESLWTHFDGRAVAGTLTGVELERLPVQTLSWADFLETHPDGIVLTRDTGYQRSYGRNPYEGYDTTETDPFLFRGEVDPRLAAKQRVVSISDGDDSVAIVLDHLVDRQVLTVDVAARELTVWHLPGTASALDTGVIAEGRDVGAVGVFESAVGDTTLTFARTDAGTFVDDETGSTWTIDGVAIAGELAGTRLTAVPHLDTFWFAIAAFRPDTEIVASG